MTNSEWRMANGEWRKWWVVPAADAVRPIAVGAFAARVTAELWSAPLPLVSVLALGAVCIIVISYFIFKILRLPLRLRLGHGLGQVSDSQPPISNIQYPISNIQSEILNFKSLWPALLLLVYVVWPARDLRVAGAVALLAILTTVSNLPSNAVAPISQATQLPQSLVFAISLIVYLLTFQKDVLPADSGEFQLVASRLGVAHPPGYPLYTMVGKLSTLLMPGNPALGLNLMSAVLAAATLTLVCATVQRLVKSNKTAGAWGGLAAALALGGSTTFWAQATTANIRMPTMFFLAWCAYEISDFRFQISNSDDRYPMSTLARFALALSLGLGHHPSLAFIGFFLVLYPLLVDPTLMWTPRRWLRPLAAFGLGQLAWLYLPIRGTMGALFAPDNLASLEGFLYHVLAKGFGGDMFAFAGWDYFPARAALVPMLLLFQFNAALLVASAFGALVTAWRDWRLAIALLGGWGAHVYITITYRAPQTVEYMMPAYLLQVIALGLGVSHLVEWSSSLSRDKNVPHPFDCASLDLARDRQGKLVTPSPRRLVTLSPCLLISLSSIVLLSSLLNGAAHAPGYIQLAGDRSTRDYVVPILQAAPPGALILADWHWATPMEYLQIVEGWRPDVEVEYVYPVGGVEYATRWLQRIGEEIGGRPVVVTRYSGLEYAASEYAFQPLGRAFRVFDRPTYNLPPGFTPAQLDFSLESQEAQAESRASLGQVGIIGYRLDGEAFQAGEAVELALAWRPLAELEHGYSFTVHLLDAAGRHLVQYDRVLPAKARVPGGVYVEQFVLPLALELLPGQYQVAVGVYYIPPEGGWRNLSASGHTLAPLAEFSLAPSTRPPLTLHPLDVPFEGGIRLLGVDHDRSDPATLRVYLHWEQGMSKTRTTGGVIIRVQAGDTVDERPLPDVPGGAYFSTVHDFEAESVNGSLEVVLYGETGSAVKSAGAWGLARTSVRLPQPSPGSRYVLFGDQLALTNVSTRLSSPRLGPNEELQLGLTFVARRSLVSDNSMNVRLQHREWAWWVPQDTKPALDTARTFKWIAGSRVVDPHRLTLPPDAAPGWADAHLKVYDEFRQAILPPLDTRMGDSVLLGSWEVGP